MKLCYLSASTIPSDKANAVHVMKMAEAFGNLIHTTLVFRPGESEQNIFDYYDVKRNFTPMPLSFAATGAGRLIATAIHARNNDYDFLYARDAMTLNCAEGTDAKLGLELHILPDSRHQKMAFDKITKSNNLRAIICISDALRDDLLAKYPDLNPEIVGVAHDGSSLPPANLPDMRTQRPGSPNAFHIGYAGSLHKGKGGELFPHLAKALPQVHFHVFGGKPEQIEKLREMDGGKCNNLHFHGHIEHHLVQAWLDTMDILIAPFAAKITIADGSDIARWTSPLKLFEYMAAHKPIICTDLPVLREIGSDGEHLFFVTPGQVKTWVYALEKLMNNDSLRVSLAHNAYSHFKEYFTWQARATHILNLLKA